MDRSDEFEGDNVIDTSVDHTNTVRISWQRVRIYDELVPEGADLDIASVFVKIAGYPPQILCALSETSTGSHGGSKKRPYPKKVKHDF